MTTQKLKCPQCGSANTKWYDGALGYEAIRCYDCKKETDANGRPDSWCRIASLQTEEDILTFTLVGKIRNNWRQRMVELYLDSENSKTLYMIGRPFSGGQSIVSHEPIGLNERAAMDYWKNGKKILVRD